MCLEKTIFLPYFVKEFLQLKGRVRLCNIIELRMLYCREIFVLVVVVVVISYKYVKMLVYLVLVVVSGVVVLVV